MSKAKIRNLSFDDGYESFTVNGDKDRVIRFNPADPELINRVLKVQEKFKNFEIPDNIELNPDGSPKSEMEKGGAYVAEFTAAMRDIFNDIFLSDVFDTIFAGQSPLCIVGQNYLFEGVLDGLLELMQPAMEEYSRKNQQKMSKYTGDL